MDERKRKDLSKYRFERAEEELDTAKQLLAMGKVNKSVSSSYYAMFHAARSVLALDGFDAKKHSSVISYFSANYVRTGVFDADVSRLIWSAFVNRGYSDYKDYYTATHETAQEQISNAERIISLIKPYLESTWTEMEDES